MRRPIILAGAATLIATPALAHLDPVAHGSLASGLSHPLFGLDHVLAMLAIGLWASVIGRTAHWALWALPASFVGAMLVGYGGGLAGLALPAMEPMILASVIVIGALIANAGALPAAGALGVAALFGAFHGNAHATEIGGAGLLTFGLGFVIATALLHGAGVAAGLLLDRTSAGSGALVTRILGGATAVGGIAMTLAG